MAFQATTAIVTAAGRTAGRAGAPKAHVSLPVVLFPTALAIRPFSAVASVFVVGILIVWAFGRRDRVRKNSLGPFALLIAAAAMVAVRTEFATQFIYFVFASILIYCFIVSVPARELIGSLTDGVGLYLIVNCVGYVSGLRSPAAAFRISESLQQGDFIRVIFPFTWGLDSAPCLASVYVAAGALMVTHGSSALRLFRWACLSAAFAVLVFGASRTSLVAALVVPLVGVFMPKARQHMAAILAIFAPFSFLLLPHVSPILAGSLRRVLALVPGRTNVTAVEYTTLNSRDYIWSRSLEYWGNHVNDIFDQLAGFGQNGQKTSGAWTAYGRAIASTVRYPERASMHNSYLQQLFDGGLIGWGLFAAAIIWASFRLAGKLEAWGRVGVIATLAASALLVNAMTQVTIAPGPSQEGFWVMLALVGATCQGRADLSYGPDPTGKTKADLGH